MDSHEHSSRHTPATSTSTPQQLRAKALAEDRRAAMRRRTRRIRRSVAGLAAMLFSSAFLVIYVQLASGHDPALAANAKRETRSATSTQSRTTTAAAQTSTASESAGSESTGGSSSSSGAESSSGASAVTTSQS